MANISQENEAIHAVFSQATREGDFERGARFDPTLVDIIRDKNNGKVLSPVYLKKFKPFPTIANVGTLTVAVFGNTEPALDQENSEDMRYHEADAAVLLTPADKALIKPDDGFETVKGIAAPPSASWVVQLLAVPRGTENPGFLIATEQVTSFVKTV